VLPQRPVTSSDTLPAPATSPRGVTKGGRHPTCPSPSAVALQRGQGLGTTAPAPFCLPGESAGSGDADLRVLNRISADPIRLAAS
jgi:hypothetical protein